MTMEEKAMEETAMAVVAGGGSDLLLPLPPWASPIFMFIFIPPCFNKIWIEQEYIHS